MYDIELLTLQSFQSCIKKEKTFHYYEEYPLRLFMYDTINMKYIFYN